jgi:hypothetical protein
MNDPFIPMNAYIFIGVASLVLAFVTVMDNPDVENTNEEKSLTEYLPSFNGTTENANPETVNEVPEQPNSNNNPTGEVSTGNDMFNSNLNSDQGLAQNEVPLIQPAPASAPPQSNDMFNTNLNSDQGLAQNEVPLIQPAPVTPVVSASAPPQSNDMFNTNLNSDQGLAQNEVPLIQQAPLPAPQPKQAPAQNYGNPFNGGKNKTNKNGYGKKENKQNKHNKKTKRNKITK